MCVCVCARVVCVCVSVCMRVCMCVCGCERERERENACACVYVPSNACVYTSINKWSMGMGQQVVLGMRPTSCNPGTGHRAGRDAQQGTRRRGRG